MKVFFGLDQTPLVIHSKSFHDFVLADMWHRRVIVLFTTVSKTVAIRKTSMVYKYVIPEEIWSSISKRLGPVIKKKDKRFGMSRKSIYSLIVTLTGHWDESKIELSYNINCKRFNLIRMRKVSHLSVRPTGHSQLEHHKVPKLEWLSTKCTPALHK